MSCSCNIDDWKYIFHMLFFQHLIIENEALKQEIIRLKNDNARLIQQTKHAESDRAAMCVSMEGQGLL
jgi:hypothetical protein